MLRKALYMCLKYDLFASLGLKKKKPFADQAIILFLAFTQHSPNMENHWNSSQRLAWARGGKRLHETTLCELGLYVEPQECQAPSPS